MNIFKVVAFVVIVISAMDSRGQIKILFDATKAESAGNADWVIDADIRNIDWYPNALIGTGPFYTSSNAQRTPTPLQSGVTSSSFESYWSGGISAWAIDCAKRGYVVESLPWNGQITYGNTSNPQDLSNYKVFVVDEPNIKFTSAEKTAIMLFVQNGGGLFMVADHDVSDRNGDGWDSPGIWNDLLSNNSVQNYPFGIYFDLANFSQTSTNISASATDPAINGPMGAVTRVKWANGTSMTLDPVQNSSVKGVIYTTGSAPGNANAMVAYARYGTGRVAALGDSSPTDDGTGNPACTLYPGYLGEALGNHQLLIMNLTIWLTGENSIGIDNTNINIDSYTVTVFPNPSNGVINVSTGAVLTNTSINIYNFAGQLVAAQKIGEFTGINKQSFTLPPGTYIMKAQSDEGLQTTRFTVY